MTATSTFIEYKTPVVGHVEQIKPILAIDPGPTHSAYVLWNGSIQEMGFEENFGIREIAYCKTYPIRSVAIEMIASYGMAVGKTTFDTCVQIGKFAEAFSPIPSRFTYRKDVKLYLCGSMRAKDTNIRQALIDKIGPQGTKKNPGPTYGVSRHIWSALAVAIYDWETQIRFL